MHLNVKEKTKYRRQTTDNGYKTKVLLIILLLFSIWTAGDGRLLSFAVNPALQAGQDTSCLNPCIQSTALLPISEHGRSGRYQAGREQISQSLAVNNISSEMTSGLQKWVALQAGLSIESGWLDELLGKIQQVESSGNLNPPDGDGGLAVGPLQIHQCAIDDVNKRLGTDFTSDDVRDIETARFVAKAYITIWLDRHKEEIAARIFNGGPRGWQKKTTNDYWKDITSVK